MIFVVCEHQIGSWGEQEGPVGAPRGLMKHWGVCWSTEGPVGELKEHSSPYASPSRHRVTATAIHVEIARERSGVRLHSACYDDAKVGLSHLMFYVQLSFTYEITVSVAVWSLVFLRGKGIFGNHDFSIPKLYWVLLLLLYVYTLKLCRVTLSDIDPRNHPHKFVHSDLKLLKTLNYRW